MRVSVQMGEISKGLEAEALVVTLNDGCYVAVMVDQLSADMFRRIADAIDRHGARGCPARLT